MNRSQWIVVLCGAVVLIGMVALPPWRCEYVKTGVIRGVVNQPPEESWSEFKGYHPLWAPPLTGFSTGVWIVTTDLHIDYPWLIAQMACVLGLAAVLLLVLRCK